MNDLFKKIKQFTKMIPKIKNYFINLLKLEPKELDFIVENVSNYKEYINIIEKDIKYLNSGVIIIFPKNLIKKDFKDKKNILFQIINILRENKDNILLDTVLFRKKFPKYLDNLNSEQKLILKNFLELNNPNDQIVRDINFHLVKSSKDNKLIVNTLTKYRIEICNGKDSYDFLMTSFSNIDFEKLTDEQIEKLFIIISNMKYLNENNLLKLYTLVLCKLKNLKDFERILWKIFRDNNCKNIMDDGLFLQTNFNIFWVLYNNKKDETNENIFIKMFYFFKNNEAEKLSLEFLENISKIPNMDFSLKIINNILSKENLNNKEFEIIIFFFISLPIENSESSLKNLLKASFNESKTIIKEIEINDFYRNSNKITASIRIFNIINKYQEFNELKQDDFYKKSIIGFNKFEKSVQDNNKITFSQLKILEKLINQNNAFFNEKLIYFDIEKKNIIINNIKNKYLYFSKKKEKLEQCLKYLEEFSTSEDIKLKSLIISKIKYSDKSLQKFEENLKQQNFLKQIDQLFERVKKFNKMKTLKVTSIFLNELENKIEKEEEKIKYLENRINEAKKILSIVTIKEIDKNLLYEYLSLFQDKESLLNEINNLKFYFNINLDENSSLIENYLFFNLKKSKIQKILNDLINVFKLFNVVRTKFSIKINELIKRIQDLENDDIKAEDNLNLEKVIQNISSIDLIINEFENIEPSLNLKIIPMDIALYTIGVFQENALLTFLFKLTLDDLRDITNSIAGSSFDINDINNYQIIKSIINKLKENCGFKENDDYFYDDVDDEEDYIMMLKPILTDIKFLKLIPQLISEKFNGKEIEEIKSILKFSAKNQPKLSVLFDNKKGFESSKQDIKSIV